MSTGHHPVRITRPGLSAQPAPTSGRCTARIVAELESGTLRKSKEACQSGRMGLTANELSSYRGPEVQILSPPLRQPNKAPVAQRIEHLTTDQKVGSSNLFGRALVKDGAGAK